MATAHLADGFEPARLDGYSRDLNPVELILRAWHHWERNRWPGRNGRIEYAHSLYAAFLLRQLQYLSLRIWEQDASERLSQLQGLLDTLNAGMRGPWVRDVRWLVQTAQGPLTRHLKPYFVMATRVTSSLSARDRLEVHRAGAVLAGGHLRSQLRHRARETGRLPDDHLLLAMTRSSSAMNREADDGNGSVVPGGKKLVAGCKSQRDDGAAMSPDRLDQPARLKIAKLDLPGFETRGKQPSLRVRGQSSNAWDVRGPTTGSSQRCSGRRITRCDGLVNTDGLMTVEKSL